MGKKLYEEENIRAIAEKIRELNPNTGVFPYKVADMPFGIELACQEAQLDGYDEGYDEGYRIGLEEGFEGGWYDGWYDGYMEGEDFGYSSGYADGKSARYNVFWDVFQASGKRRLYNYAFSGDAWTEETFKPKYDLKPTQAYSMFMYHGYQRDINPHPITDLKGALERAGVTLDTSGTSDMKRIFYVSSSITMIPTISFESCENTTEAFRSCTSLVSIDKIVLKNDGTNTFSNTFRDCHALTEVGFKGVIGQNGFNVQWSPLSHASLMSIIEALQDKRSDTSGTEWVCTIGDANYAKLSSDEINIAINRGWNLV